MQLTQFTLMKIIGIVAALLCGLLLFGSKTDYRNVRDYIALFEQRSIQGPVAIEQIKLVKIQPFTGADSLRILDLKMERERAVWLSQKRDEMRSLNKQIETLFLLSNDQDEMSKRIVLKEIDEKITKKVKISSLINQLSEGQYIDTPLSEIENRRIYYRKNINKNIGKSYLCSYKLSDSNKNKSKRLLLDNNYQVIGTID